MCQEVGGETVFRAPKRGPVGWAGVGPVIAFQVFPLHRLAPSRDEVDVAARAASRSRPELCGLAPHICGDSSPIPGPWLQWVIHDGWAVASRDRLIAGWYKVGQQCIDGFPISAW